MAKEDYYYMTTEPGRAGQGKSKICKEAYDL